MAKKKAASLVPKLTKTEQDLLSHIEGGYQLETNSLGGDPVLKYRKIKISCSAGKRYCGEWIRWRRLEEASKLSDSVPTRAQGPVWGLARTAH